MTEFDKDSMFNEFTNEVQEHIDAIDNRLGALEENPEDMDAVEDLLRAIHTIKGSAAVMGYDYVENFTSSIETILEQISSHQIEITDDIIGTLKDSNDALKIMVNNIDQGMTEENKLIWEELAPVLKEISGTAEPEIDVEEPLEESEPSESQGFDNDDILGFFIIEAEEYIDIYNEDLKKIEENPDDESVLENLLTTAHTLKGSAAMMELEYLSKLAKMFESVLKQIRNRETEVENVIDLLYESVEGFEAMVDQIKNRKIEENKEILEIFRLEYESHEEKLRKWGEPEVVPSETGREEEGEEDEDLIVLFAEEAYRYVEKIRDDVNKLIENRENRELLEELEVTAHTLKGSSLTMGFNTVGQMALEFQEIVRLVLEDEAELDDALLAVLERCSTYLKEMVNNIVDGKAEENKKILENLRPEMEWIVETAKELEEATEAEFEFVPEESRVIPDLSDDIQEYFLIEASEHLQNIDQELLELEKSPRDVTVINRLFRSLHTLKGSASIVGYVHVSNLAHIMEEVLAKARKQSISLTDPLIELLFEGLDNLRKFLKAKSPEVFNIIDSLTLKFQKAVKAAGEEYVPTAKDAITEKSTEALTEPMVLDVEKQTVRINISQLDRLMNLIGELVINRARLDQRISNLMNLSTDLESTKHHLISTVKNFYRKYEFTSPNQQNSEAGTDKIADEFHDLEFDKYDDFNILSRNLIDVSSQMTDIMNQLVSFFGEFREETSHISSVTNELQEGITNVRMVPIERLFKRYQRPVRDLAKAHEKKVEMEIQGGDTVLDKRLVEELADPLLHIVRNAVYHGIEPADVRERLGKPPTGKILLEAYHEGDSITITIQDDGRGIDGNRIKQSALQKGLITRAEYDSMTEEDAVNLVYLPGMSTLDVADGVSGRGVGMDVVLNNISELNGTIEIETAKSEGTKFVISLPLTLAISKALLLNVQDETFAVPLNSVLEILFIRKDEVKVVSGDEVIILREDVIPLKRLGNILNFEARANGSLKYPVVIVGTAERRTALLVDKLLGREDIVVKSIGEFLSDVELFSGATISGEGKVRLILDVQKIVGYTIKSAGRVKVKAGMAPAKSETVEGKGEAMGSPKILLVDDSISIRKFVGKLLERSGFQVTVAVDGLDALNKIEQDTYDFFIVDLEMPRMHGYELIERLRQRSDFVQTPIMVMTSRSGEKHRQKAISLGADDYIVKPFTEETLIGTINRLLSV